MDTVIQIPGITLIRNDRNEQDSGVASCMQKALKVKVPAKSNIQGLGKPGTPEYLICSV